MPHSTNAQVRLTKGMAPFRYDRIDLAKDAIRLIRLFQGRGSDRIECEIFDSFLHEAENVPYEALSYTWGKSSKRANIFINGQEVEVTNHLYLALRDVRKLDEDRILWVDAICIDQAHYKERAHQVGQMPLIYRNAEQVLIWLGRASFEISLILDLTIQLEESVLEDMVSWKSQRVAQSIWPRLLQRQEGTDTILFARQRKGLEELLQKSWFRRVWILQEAAYAKRARVFCGPSSISSSAFTLMPSLMGVKPNDHAEAVLQIMPGHFRHGRWKNTVRLGALLARFGSSEASIARDKIYALLGLSLDACGGDVFISDYSINDERVLQNTLSFLLFGRIVDVDLYGIPCWTMERIVELLKTPSKLSAEVFRWSIMTLNTSLGRKMLIEGVVDILEFCHEESSAQLLATQLNDAPRIELLCYSPAVRGIGLQDDAAPLWFAAKNSSNDLAQPLLNWKANVESDEFLYMASGNSEPAMVTSISHKVARADATAFDLFLLTSPLDKRKKLQWKDAYILLRHGAQVSCCPWRPYHWLPAMPPGEDPTRRFQEFLREVGSSNSNHSAAEILLNIAVFYEEDHIVEILLEQGFPVNHRCSHGRTALSEACMGSGNADIIQLLLRHGADANSADNEGYTPFILAVRSARWTICRILLETKSVIKTSINKSCLLKHALTSTAHERLILNTLNVLVENGLVDVNCTRPDDLETWIGWLTKRKRSNDDRTLLEMAANVEALHSSGKTPMYLASEANDMETLGVLKRFAKMDLGAGTR